MGDLFVVGKLAINIVFVQWCDRKYQAFTFTSITSLIQSKALREKGPKCRILNRREGHANHTKEWIKSATKYKNIDFAHL